MRHLTTILPAAVLFTGCLVGGPTPDPPLLSVTSPQRSLVQDHAGSVTVTGNIAPNPTGAPVASVVVNGTRASIAVDGSWTATIDVPVGATLIHTVATDAAGGIATDTRSIEAGERRAPGSNVEHAIGVSISAKTFGQIGNVASALIKQTNLMQLIQPLNPVVHAGDTNGQPDCLYGQAFVDNVTITDAKITLAPVTGGIQFSATLDHPNITGHAMFAVACVKGQSTFQVTADSASISGVLGLTVNGTAGLTSSLDNPQIATPGLQIMASGIPQSVLNIIPLEKVVQFVGPTAARMFVTPMLNDALGTLTGPQKIQALGQTIDLQVSPTAVSFDAAAGNIALDMKLLIEGTENSPGYTFTPNDATPSLDAGDGLALGIADDIANEALSQLVSTGLLNLMLPGTTAQLQMTSPPMISGDPGDGKLHLFLPDMMVMFGPNGRAAINAQIPLSISPSGDGTSVSIELGQPSIAIDELDPGQPVAADLRDPVTTTTGMQKGAITDMLQNIPLPKIGGLTLKNASVTGGNAGYLMVKTSIGD